MRTLLEVGYVVFFGTFISYLLMINGQRTLRPTVVSIYNYMQPLVAVVVSVTLGLAVFTLTHALAVALIFSGVWLVAISRSRQKGVRVILPISGERLYDTRACKAPKS